MRVALAAVAITAAAAAAGCGADRIPDAATTPDPVPTAAETSPAAPNPTVTPSTEGPTPGTTEPTPTQRVIGPPLPPSEGAARCTAAGLVAAALDACLRYEAEGCDLTDRGDLCASLRDQLDVVVGTTIFPADCDDLDLEQVATAPPWCSSERES